METARSALQVGILVFVAIILFGFGYIFFYGSLKSQSYYHLTVQFKDASEIRPGAEVDMSGVKVGQLAPDGVRLDPKTNRALLDLQIDRNVHVPVNSLVTIATSLLGGSATISIVPPYDQAAVNQSYYSPGSVINGTEPFSLVGLAGQTGQLLHIAQTAAKKADKLIDTVTSTTQDMNGLLTNQQMRNNLEATTENIRLASEQGVVLTKQLESTLAEDNGSVQQLLHNVNGTAGQFNQLAAQNKGKLSQLITNLNQTTQNLSSLTAQANETLTKGHVADNLSSTVSNLKDATSKLSGIASDLEKVTSDPQIQSNLKTTIQNIATTSQQTSQLVTRLNGIVGGGHGVHRGPAAPAFVSRLDFSENLRTNRFRTDFDVLAPIGRTDLFRVGLHDVTGSNNLTLQYGRSSTYNRGLIERAGIYAGKVGVGADYDLFKNNSLSLDLYDPNKVHLDVTGRIKLSDETALIIGGENLTHRAGAVVGVELRR